jgi:hypothetical protein
MAYLRQEARMLRRTAALYYRDPRDDEAAAAVLALRGVHKTVDAARSAVRGHRSPCDHRLVKSSSIDSTRSGRAAICSS